MFEVWSLGGLHSSGVSCGSILEPSAFPAKLQVLNKKMYKCSVASASTSPLLRPDQTQELVEARPESRKPSSEKLVPRKS